MLKRTNQSGTALLLTLAVLLLVVILANVILSLISSQSALTSHQLKRIQAYYASLAGVNYALERLRLTDAAWEVTPGQTKTLTIGRSSGDVVEPDLPPFIDEITVTLTGEQTGRTRIDSTVNYTSGL